MKETILYVDDEEINLFLFQNTMHLHFEILVASSGEEGLTILAENNNISAVVSDMSMPEMNGVEFISTAKPMYPNIAYLILTGFSFNQEIKEAIESGLISQYLTKPYEVDHLANTINELMQELKKS